MRRTFDKIRKRIPGSHDVDDLGGYANMTSISEDGHASGGFVTPYRLHYPNPTEFDVRRHHRASSAQDQWQRRATIYNSKDLPQLPPEANIEAYRNLPFPNEIFYLVIDRYLFDDVVTLLRLAKAIPLFLHQCWTHAFRTVPVSIREREINRKKLTSNVDLFLQLITSTPRVQLYVRGLDISDYGRNTYKPLLGPTSAQDINTLAMLLVQTKRMPNLRSFKIRCWVHWSNFSKQLQSSFITLLESPSLEEVSLVNLALPVNLLALAPRLRNVDFQSGGVGPPVIYPGISVAPAKRIHTLKVRDRNKFGQAMSTLGFVDTRTPPFNLYYLVNLEICLPGNQLNTVQTGLSHCTSLESLKIFVGTAGGLPSSLDLGCLRRLKSLTLSADVTSILESEHRFFWLTTTLTTLPKDVKPPVLHDLTILIRIDSLQRGKEFEWDAIDKLFPKPKPPPRHGQPEADMWDALKAVNIIWCTGRQKDLQEDLNQDFVECLPVAMPLLTERNILNVRTTYSDASYNFWTFS
ncbi:hypothetical protein FA15DRAFT_668334 [Coprinopsis marcescibilis]|uniref:F-box domain-containing protein n=1 Tax=Coprinopsis marcescibilis TaxID=230819 RepID=A0A5C3KZB7_COPMA|nr:hypothetical protein FA15DRAFT_668334 [Coprinopsis marcescibilis]